MSDQPPPSPVPPAPTDSPKTPIYRRRWFIPLLAGIVGVGIGMAAGGGSEGTEGSDPAAQPEPAVTVTVEVDGEVEPAETVTVDPAPEIQAELDARAAELDALRVELDARASAVAGAEAAAEAGTIPGDGTFLVGTDIQPGTYRSAAPSSGNCYWARLASLEGFDITNNGNSAGPSVVEIAASDAAFESSGCDDWTIVQ